MFSVAAELHYHMWTELAALIAVVLVVAQRPRRRLGWVVAPAALTVLAGVAFRLAA